MKNLTLLPLAVLISTALAGCGGSSGGGGTPNPVKVYTWQVVDLYKENRENVSSDCAILANEVDLESSNQVIASRVADRHLRILFHNEDGSIDESKTIDESDIAATGKVSFLETDVPANGFVSLEEFEGRVSGERESYMFGVHKSLLQNLTIAIGSQQANSNACWKGEQKNELILNDNAAVKVVANDGPKYFMTSGPEARVSGGSMQLGLPVISNVPASAKQLVTAYSQYIDEKPNELTQYAVIDAENIYDTKAVISESVTELIPQTVESTDFHTDLTLIAGSQTQVVLDQKIYAWQMLNEDTQNLGVVPTDDQFSKWSTKVIGQTDNSTGSWSVFAQLPLTSNGLIVNAPQLSSFANSTIASCGTGYCVDLQGYSVSDFDVQRTSIRSTSTDNKNFVQTIYAPVTLSQVVLESATESLNPQSSDTIEVTLVETDAALTDAAKFIMLKSLDKQSVVNAELQPFKDFNGVVEQTTAERQFDIEFMAHKYISASNVKN